MTYRIATFADTHLGYAARCRAHASGLNMRNRDGLLGLRETVNQILNAEVDLVVQAGDLFHRSHPAIGEIAWARQQLDRFSQAGIPVIVVTGNHDFANDRGKSPATAAIHDPGRNISAITAPYQVLHPVAGLNVHAVSHLGVAAAERAIPEPVDREVNILVSHGAAQVPGHEMFACVDSPGEAVVGYDILTLPWTVTLLGHYHGMGPLPGFDDGDTGQAWYAGSLLRRGFSDPEGGRGWLLTEIADDGTVTTTRQYVKQRPQFDLPKIDAAGLTGAEVEEQIRANLAEIEIGDAIIRQRVINCPVAVRRGVDARALGELAADALVWQPEFIRPLETELSDLADADEAVGSLITAGSADLPTMFTGWFADYATKADLAPTLREPVVTAAVELLRQVSMEAETGTSEVLSTAKTAGEVTLTDAEVAVISDLETGEDLDEPFAGATS